METKKDEIDKRNRSLEQAIRDIDKLYQKAGRFLTPELQIKLTEKLDNLIDFLNDLIW